MPVTDILQLDDLQDIANPQSQPFYQVLPDQNDCRDAFGDERSIQYVCQENLERLTTAEDIAGLNIDMNGRYWRWLPDHQRYEAPAMVRFRHGEYAGDYGVLEIYMERFEDSINAWQSMAGQRYGETNPALCQLCTANLLQLLQAVDNVADAKVIEDLIKEIGMANPDKTLTSLMHIGVGLLVAGQAEEAYKTFDRVLAKDSRNAEAWYQLGTTTPLLGRHVETRLCTEQALDLEPFHVQANIRMGLILFGQQDYQQAEEVFRTSLKLNPWASVSSQLSICVDMLS